MHNDLKLEIDVVIQLISDSDQLSESTRAWILGVMKKVKMKTVNMEGTLFTMWFELLHSH
ncbi:hypothetical protein PCI56_00760 [Plesiomonas shigelloides subsp. oncorhynchi]|nr:hypothetical protein [Plesiomonas shigelloides]